MIQRPKLREVPAAGLTIALVFVIPTLMLLSRDLPIWIRRAVQQHHGATLTAYRILFFGGMSWALFGLALSILASLPILLSVGEAIFDWIRDYFAHENTLALEESIYENLDSSTRSSFTALHSALVIVLSGLLWAEAASILAAVWIYE